MLIRLTPNGPLCSCGRRWRGRPSREHWRSFRHALPTRPRVGPRCDLAASRWPDGYRCPRCEHGQAFELPRRGLWQCKACGHQTSVTAGTVLHRSRTPLREWFWAAYLITTHTPGMSALQLATSARHSPVRNSLDPAPETAPRHAPSRARAAAWHGRGRRDVHRQSGRIAVAGAQLGDRALVVGAVEV